jgi:hypothetical protein
MIDVKREVNIISKSYARLYPSFWLRKQRIGALDPYPQDLTGPFGIGGSRSEPDARRCEYRGVNIPAQAHCDPQTGEPCFVVPRRLAEESEYFSMEFQNISV